MNEVDKQEKKEHFCNILRKVEILYVYSYVLTMRERAYIWMRRHRDINLAKRNKKQHRKWMTVSAK